MKTDTRSQLLKAACELLDKGGPAAVTLREVGRRAGVSHNAPYRHFTSKDQLLASIAGQEMQAQSKAMKELLAKGSPEETLRGALHGYVRWASAYPERFILTFGPLPGAGEELKAMAGEARKLLVDLVASVQQKGALPSGDPERMASLLQALAHGAADLALNGHLSATGKGNADPEEIVDDLLDYLKQSATGRDGRRRKVAS